jgi:hypothetical protein
MGWSALTHKGCLFCFVGIQNEQKHYLSVVTQIMSLQQKPYEHNANMTLEILPLALCVHLKYLPTPLSIPNVQFLGF